MTVPAFLRGFPPLLRSSSGINQSLLQEYTEISPPQRGLPGPLHPKPLSPPIAPHPTATSGFFPAVTSRAGDLSLHLQIDVQPPVERKLSRGEIVLFHKASTLLSTLSTSLVPRKCLAVSQVRAWPQLPTGCVHIAVVSPPPARHHTSCFQPSALSSDTTAPRKTFHGVKMSFLSASH